MLTFCQHHISDVHIEIGLGLKKSLGGDVNDDGTINIIDIVLIVGCILDENNNCQCSDINSDGTIDVMDIIIILDVIINS